MDRFHAQRGVSPWSRRWWRSWSGSSRCWGCTRSWTPPTSSPNRRRRWPTCSNPPGSESPCSPASSASPASEGSTSETPFCLSRTTFPAGVSLHGPSSQPHFIRRGTDVIEVRGVFLGDRYILDEGDVTCGELPPQPDLPVYMPESDAVRIPWRTALGYVNFPFGGSPSLATRTRSFYFAVVSGENQQVTVSGSTYLVPIYARRLRQRGSKRVPMHPFPLHSDQRRSHLRDGSSERRRPGTERHHCSSFVACEINRRGSH